jgi:hypothetical protein
MSTMDWELTHNLPRRRLSIRNKHLEVNLAAIQHDALVLPNASATHTSSSLAQPASPLWGEPERRCFGMTGCMQKESLAFSRATWKSPGRSWKCPWSARRPKIETNKPLDLSISHYWRGDNFMQLYPKGNLPRQPARRNLDPQRSSVPRFGATCCTLPL